MDMTRMIFNRDDEVSRDYNNEDMQLKKGVKGGGNHQGGKHQKLEPIQQKATKVVPPPPNFGRPQESETSSEQSLESREEQQQPEFKKLRKIT
jgi:hypothetical protein